MKMRFFVFIYQVMAAFSNAEKKLKPNVSEMFTDVYNDVPAHLQ